MLKVLLLLFGVAAAATLGALDVHTTTIHAATIPAVVMAVAANVDPIFVSVAAAAELLATSRSEIYQKLARGGSPTKSQHQTLHAANAKSQILRWKSGEPGPRLTADRLSARPLRQKRTHTDVSIR